MARGAIKSVIKKIKKRNGKIVAFSPSKIERAIWQAFKAAGEGSRSEAKNLTQKVIKELEERFNSTIIPEVEQVQDLIEQILLRDDFEKTYRAFTLYRELHRKLRDVTSLVDSDELIEKYLEKMDWRVKENANMTYSLQGLNNHVASIISANFWLNKIYPREIRKAHVGGDLHIHDLASLSPYCTGWDLRDFLIRGFGGVPGKIHSAPPKHFSTALGQLVNFMYTIQGEVAGAVAVSNFDTYLAPFIRYDKLSYKEVKQAMQEFVFNMNVPTRVGFQCFSEDTEILTAEGWKNYREVKKGMVIKTFNLQKGRIEDKRVKSVFKRKYSGIMYRLKNRIQDQLISPRHRVVRKEVSTGDWVMEPIEKVIEKDVRPTIPIYTEKEKIVTTQIEDIVTEEYSGVIWCPHTDNETVIARRKGKVFISGNTPFSNVTLDLKPTKTVAEESVIIGGKVMKAKYKEFQKEMDMFNRAFAEVMMEGDAQGRVFTFPIPTYSITKDFDWDNPNLEPMWEMTRKYGVPYFANFVNSEMDPDDVRSMCCRLRLDNRVLRRRGGLFAANPLTGSVGVVTINLPRLGYLARQGAKGEGFARRRFFTLLGRLMDLAKESLLIKRRAVEDFTHKGLYPYCRYYLSDIYARNKVYWRNHFNTIGINGMNEALLNFLGKSIADPEGKAFALEVLDYMREKILIYQKETDEMFNLEATPAEGTSYRFARIDKEKHPEIICANEEDWRKKKAAPFYTNSTHLPVDYTDDIFEALDHQDELQCKYTGGTVLHGFLGESPPSTTVVKKLVKKIAENYRLPYFSITPTFSICPKHGYLAGEWEYCPKCDEEIGYKSNLPKRR